ncbi:hypothetical protein V6N13_010361 [Hibiscus sabdariffa]
MAQKHLHELLEEDQEPFVLKNFIADRRCQLKKSSPQTHLQIKKRKPITQSSSFPSNFCKNACFLSFHDTATDPGKSPLFEFPSPVKSPNAIFLNIPARSAALLLESALRIQKKSSSKSKNNGTSSGLFASILKRLTLRSRNPKREIAKDGAQVPVKDILRRDSTVGKNDPRQRKTLLATEDQSGRPSSAVWSEKSMDVDLDTSCSCSHGSEDFEEVFVSKDGSAFASFDKHFCESPFHFVLQKSPSFNHGTPLFSSPTTSPSRRQKEDKENYETESFGKLQVEEEEEEKEQCSPVSVLDPPFEDDDVRHVDDEDDDDNDNDNDNNADENKGFDLEWSFANVQRAKQQLLHKLLRFEKLAKLDPIELEKRMLEHDDDDDYRICDLDKEDELENELISSESEMDIDIDVSIQEVLKSSFCNGARLPDSMKRLLSALIAEEETDMDQETMALRVCKRLEAWKHVESSTIDMMVGQDFRRSQIDGWKRNQEHIKETASELEYAIFGLLMEELSEELVCLPGI